MMKVLLFLLSSVWIRNVSGIDIFEGLANIKKTLFGGLLGDGGNCGCACRDYYVAKCDIEYVEECYQEHYETKCVQKPIIVPRKAKEIECQKCRKFHITVYQPKWFKECNPVFDEKCTTKYHKHCKTNEKCTEIYQTVCQTQYGYQQECQQIPAQTCYPETVCHNTPQTTCYPVKGEKCEKVKKDVPVQKEQRECLPFPLQYPPEPDLGSAQCTEGFNHIDTGYGGHEVGYGGQEVGYGGHEVGYGGLEVGYGDIAGDPVRQGYSGVDIHVGSNGPDSGYTVEQGSPEPILDSYANSVAVEPANTYSTQGSHYKPSHESDSSGTYGLDSSGTYGLDSSGTYGLDTYGRRKDDRNIFVKTADTALETLKSAGSDILQVLVPGLGRRRRFQEILESTRRQGK